MREVLRVTRDRDAEAAAWLEIIDLFDRIGGSRGSGLELAQLAREATGRAVGLRDVWSAVALRVAGEVVESGDDVGADVLRAAIAHRLRGRNAAVLPLDGDAVLAASIELGAGRIGVAWLAGTEAEWRPLDYLVVERLAAALATRALELRGDGAAADPAAVERLLAGGLGDYELAQASRRARLSASHRYVIVALDQSPPNAVSLEALGTVAERAIAAAGPVARSAVAGRTAVVLVAADETPEPALRALCDGSDRLGFAIAAGVGEPVTAAELRRSWDQAREVLALRRMTAARGSVAFFRDLGELHLLAQIPTEEILASPLFQRLTGALGQHGSPSDVDVLETYLDEGTLRRAAAKVYLHHTSIEHRIKRIEEELELDLMDASTRFEVHLAVKLYRILQSRDAARAVL